MKRKVLGFLVMSAALASINFANAKALTSSINEDDDKLKASEKAVAVNYLGAYSDSKVVFDVQYSNPQGLPFNLIITNAEGDVIYDNVYKSKDFDRKVMIKKDPETDGKVCFEIKSKNGAIVKRTFAMSSNEKKIEDFRVVSVK